jgi:hypothetical protein
MQSKAIQAQRHTLYIDFCIILVCSFFSHYKLYHRKNEQNEQLYIFFKNLLCVILTASAELPPPILNAIHCHDGITVPSMYLYRNIRRVSLSDIVATNNSIFCFCCSNRWRNIISSECSDVTPDTDIQCLTYGNSLSEPVTVPCTVLLFILSFTSFNSATILRYCLSSSFVKSIPPV